MHFLTDFTRSLWYKKSLNNALCSCRQLEEAREHGSEPIRTFDQQFQSRPRSFKWRLLDQLPEMRLLCDTFPTTSIISFSFIPTKKLKNTLKNITLLLRISLPILWQNYRFSQFEVTHNGLCVIMLSYYRKASRLKNVSSNTLRLRFEAEFERFRNNYATLPIRILQSDVIKQVAVWAQTSCRRALPSILEGLQHLAIA